METGFQFGVFKGGNSGGGMSVSQWSEVEIIYVGKHGLDTNNGTAINKAKLTINAAILQAVTNGAAFNNLFSVVVLDAGTYLEEVEIYNYVKLFAPNATIQGRVIMQEVSFLDCFMVTNVSGQFVDLITFSSPLGLVHNNYIKIELLYNSDNLPKASCDGIYYNSIGFVNVNINQITVVNGVAINNSGTGQSYDFTGFVNKIRVVTEGAGIKSGGLTPTLLTVNHIEAGDNVQAILVTSGTVNILNNTILARLVAVQATSIASNTHIFSNYIQGAIVIADGVFCVVDVSKRNNYDAAASPTVNDDSLDGYSLGSVWYDSLAQIFYDCYRNNVGAADWRIRTNAAYVPYKEQFIAIDGQDTFVLSFIPSSPSAIIVAVVGVVWQDTRYTISYDVGLLAWVVVLDTPQLAGVDVIVKQ